MQINDKTFEKLVTPYNQIKYPENLELNNIMKKTAKNGGIGSTDDDSPLTPPSDSVTKSDEYMVLKTPVVNENDLYGYIGVERTPEEQRFEDVKQR